MPHSLVTASTLFPLSLVFGFTACDPFTLFAVVVLFLSSRSSPHRFHRSAGLGGASLCCLSSLVSAFLHPDCKFESLFGCRGSFLSLSLYLHSSPCSTLDRLDAVTWFGLLLLNPPLSLSCASSLLSSLSSRTRFVPHETKLSLRHLQDLFPIYSTRCSALIAWPAV